MKLPTTKKKTTADVPRSVAAEYGKARRPQAIAEAEGDGYTKTMPMKKAQQSGKSKSQFGLPPSPGRPLLKVRVHVMPDTDGDKM